MIVTPMTEEDTKRVAEIEAENFSMPWSMQGFIDGLKQEDTCFLVAKQEDEILGYIGMYISIDEGEITNVSVSSQARRMGVGELLVDELVSRALARGVSRIVLEVRVSNRAAINLYEKKGFVNLGVRKNFYERPREDAYIMALEI